jgi:hypothetical protein
VLIATSLPPRQAPPVQRLGRGGTSGNPSALFAVQVPELIDRSARGAQQHAGAEQRDDWRGREAVQRDRGSAHPVRSPA